MDTKSRLSVCYGRALLAIDPGLQGTGLAFWSANKTRPSWVKVIRPNRPGLASVYTWIDRARSLAEQIGAIELDMIIATGKEVRIVCELMEMHQSARAQMMWKTGDLQRTLVLIGMIARTDRSVELVKPSEWKGQLSKAIVERRLREKIGNKACDRLGIESHAWDAVGIGLWALGRF